MHRFFIAIEIERAAALQNGAPAYGRAILPLPALTEEERAV